MNRLTMTGLATVMAMASATALPANADTLREALAATYQNNPDLRAARAGLRATDEGVARANTAFAPSVTGTANLNKQKRINDDILDDAGAIIVPGSTSSTTNRFYQARVDQNFFNGFQDFNNHRQQKELMKAGRADLLSTEQQILMNAVTAYMDVVRDVAVLELRENNIQVLTRQLEASQDRFRVGEITRTDVAQSEARLAGAISGRIRAEADLAGSRANYERQIGQAPGTLEPPPAIPGVPPTLDDAWAIALDDNPSVISAKHVERAANFAVKGAKGAILPTLDAFATLTRQEGESFFAGQSVPIGTTIKTVGIQVQMPLYRGGAEYSDIRRAKQTASQRRLQILGVERQVVELVRIAWEEYRAAQSQIIASGSQVRANAIALDGVRQEAAVGSRTTLDVLDAEQELLDSRVNLVTSERNEYIAGFVLVSAVGRLNAVSLDLSVDLYDPDDNYKNVRYKFIGWGTKGE